MFLKFLDLTPEAEEKAYYKAGKKKRQVESQQENRHYTSWEIVKKDQESSKPQPESEPEKRVSDDSLRALMTKA